jgi:SAM-dependent MidA family methyltransferase
MRIREAMARALYGPEGFFVTERPRDHFRTSTVASPLLAGALARLIREVDDALGYPDPLTIVDIGAGRGELLTALLPHLLGPTQLELGLLSGEGGPTRARLGKRRLVAVEMSARPEELDRRIEWLSAPPGGTTGMILACEWLDNVPLDVAEVDGDGVVRYRLAEGGLGDEVTGPDRGWLARWWPIEASGEVAEVGRARDEEWVDAVATLHRGLALAIDYGHLLGQRPWGGTLTGFRAGREVEPRFDGTTDITAHVAFDSLGDGVLLTQRDALHRLGVSGERPPLALASSDPMAYLSRLNEAGEAAELTDPHGLGAHRWLLREVGVELGWLA